MASGVNKLATPWEVLKQIPRTSLGIFPTPLHKLQHLSKDLRTDTWIKRDDLISFGLGGNKIRGLEYLAADAKAQGADTLVTGAGPQSNHVRATATAAKVLGLGCTAVFWGFPSRQADGNLRVTKMLGADIQYTMDPERLSVDTGLLQASEMLRERGKRPYVIPRGGACALGSLGHVQAAREVYEQCSNAQIEPDVIVMAVGSGGTYAGWLVGLTALGLSWRILAFSVSRPPSEASREVARLANEAAQILHMEQTFQPEQCPVVGSQIGEGYGIPSVEGARAIRRFGECEGLILDPTYTGKAMAGLLNAIDTGDVAPSQRTIFLHTGGEPAFFAGNGAWLDV